MMKKFVIIIFMGFDLATALQTELHADDLGNLCLGNSDSTGTIQPRFNYFLGQRMYRNKREPDDLRLQKYNHRSIPDDNYENNPWARRYPPPNYDITRKRPPTRPRWYRKKNDEDFVNSKWSPPARRRWARVMNQESEIPKNMDAKGAMVNYALVDGEVVKFIEPNSLKKDNEGLRESEVAIENTLVDKSASNKRGSASVEMSTLGLGEPGIEKRGKESLGIKLAGVKTSGAFVDSTYNNAGDASVISDADIKETETNRGRKKKKRKKNKQKENIPMAETDSAVNVNVNRNRAEDNQETENVKMSRQKLYKPGVDEGGKGALVDLTNNDASDGTFALFDSDIEESQTNRGRKKKKRKKPKQKENIPAERLADTESTANVNVNRNGAADEQGNASDQSSTLWLDEPGIKNRGKGALVDSTDNDASDGAFAIFDSDIEESQTNRGRKKKKRKKQKQKEETDSTVNMNVNRNGAKDNQGRASLEMSTRMLNVHKFRKGERESSGTKIKGTSGASVDSTDSGPSDDASIISNADIEDLQITRGGKKRRKKRKKKVNIVINRLAETDNNDNVNVNRNRAADDQESASDEMSILRFDEPEIKNRVKGALMDSTDNDADDGVFAIFDSDIEESQTNRGRKKKKRRKHKNENIPAERLSETDSIENVNVNRNVAVDDEESAGDETSTLRLDEPGIKIGGKGALLDLTDNDTGDGVFAISDADDEKSQTNRGRKKKKRKKQKQKENIPAERLAETDSTVNVNVNRNAGKDNQGRASLEMSTRRLNVHRFGKGERESGGPSDDASIISNADFEDSQITRGGKKRRKKRKKKVNIVINRLAETDNNDNVNVNRNKAADDQESASDEMSTLRLDEPRIKTGGKGAGMDLTNNEAGDDAFAISDIDIEKSQTNRGRKKKKRRNDKYKENIPAERLAETDSTVNVNVNRNRDYDNVVLDDYEKNEKFENGKIHLSTKHHKSEGLTALPGTRNPVTSKGVAKVDMNHGQENQPKTLDQLESGGPQIPDTLIHPSKVKEKGKSPKKNNKRPSKPKAGKPKSSQNNSSSNEEYRGNIEKDLSPPEKPLKGPDSDLGSSSVYDDTVGDSANNDFQAGPAAQNFNHNLNTKNKYSTNAMDDYRVAPIRQNAMNKIAQKIIGVRRDFGRQYVDQNVRNLVNTRRRLHQPHLDTRSGGSQGS